MSELLVLKMVFNVLASTAVIVLICWGLVQLASGIIGRFDNSKGCENEPVLFVIVLICGIWLMFIFLAKSALPEGNVLLVSGPSLILSCAIVTALTKLTIKVLRPSARFSTWWRLHLTHTGPPNHWVKIT